MCVPVSLLSFLHRAFLPEACCVRGGVLQLLRTKTKVGGLVEPDPYPLSSPQDFEVAGPLAGVLSLAGRSSGARGSGSDSVYSERR